jgi:hypothetical protein
MPRVLLVATAASTCFVLVLGCESERNGPAAPLPSKARSTVIVGSSPARRAVDPASRSAPRRAIPNAPMSTPPAENIADSPESTPAPMPAPATPHRSPSQYRDGCGRPLVA